MDVFARTVQGRKERVMDEIISRQAAYDTLTEYYHLRTETQRESLKEALSRVTTIDAVPVVRCKDCRFKRGMSCDWIPCEERLPDTPAPVLITIEWADDDLEVTIGEYWSGNDGWGKVIDGKVIAWKPLPEPAGRKQKSYADWELRRG